MTTLYLDHHGDQLGFAGNRFVVRRGDGETRDYPLHQMERLIVTGHVHFTFDALAALLRYGIRTLFCSPAGGYRGQLVASTDAHVFRRAGQHRLSLDPQAKLALAREIVAAKLESQARLLHQWGGESSAVHCRLRDHLPTAPDVPALLGIEGAATREYFDGIRGRLAQTGFKFARRAYHPAPDPVNAMLSLGYALLMAELAAAAQAHGLDPWVGTLHTTDGRKPALLLDAMEPLRVVVDRLVVYLARHDVVPDDFVETAGECRMRDGRRRKLYGRWEELLAHEIAWNDRRLTYRELIHGQIELLARHFEDGRTVTLWRMR